MKLKVFNNLTRSKEEFKPVGDTVKFYSCGPTTYDFLHVGNARAAVVADLMNRSLRALGYKVKFVRNFTDVDDKIIARGNELGIDPKVHAERFIDECKKDYAYLGMKEPDATPKVTETIPEIISMIEDIIKNGFGYVVDGEVLFEVEKMKDYGKLSKKDLESLQTGTRKEIDETKKKNSADFVLWKPAKKGEEGASWNSPWGIGRPGWHIECSAMAKKHLGDTIDLHHGGVDLMFPHHENEIAQSEAANKKAFCNCWAHNEFLNFGSEKMSKSLGNVVTIRKFCEVFGGQVLRQILLSVHYRAKMEWNDEVIDRGISDVERIHEFVLECKAGSSSNPTVKKESENTVNLMKEELANDFNSAGAMSHFFNYIRFIRRESAMTDSSIKDVLNFVSDTLGLINSNPQAVLDQVQAYKKSKAGSDALDDAKIKELIEERKSAKASKNFKRSDEIRDFLKSKKIVLKDNPDGTTSYSFES